MVVPLQAWWEKLGVKSQQVSYTLYTYMYMYIYIGITIKD